MTLTFDMLVTGAAIPIVGGVIMALVELVKTAFPIIADKISGATLAFIFSAALYVAAALVFKGSTGLTPDQALNVFLSWLGVACSAIGVKSALGFYSQPAQPPQG